MAEDVPERKAKLQPSPGSHSSQETNNKLSQVLGVARGGKCREAGKGGLGRGWRGCNFNSEVRGSHLSGDVKAAGQRATGASGTRGLQASAGLVQRP